MFVIPFSSLTGQPLFLYAQQQLVQSSEQWEQQIWQFISNWLNPAITTVTVHTSGSTGAPKAIAHTKQAMLHSAAITCNAIGLTPGMQALLCLPSNKIGGMMMLVRSIYRQLDLVCIKPTTTPLARLPDGVKIDFAALTPMQLHGACKDYNQFKQADAMQTILLGGEAISAEVLSLAKKLNPAVYSTFGMTETVSHIALKKINGATPDAHYKVLGDIAIESTPEQRLIIKAPQLNQPHLLTNDLVAITAPGQFDWLGRIDNVINTGGVKIYPEQIEQQLQPNIQPAFFIGSVPDARTGQKLVLAIEMTELTSSDTAELKQIFAQLDKLHRPKTVLLYNHFIRTPNGKIQRSQTLQRSAEEVAF